ncbi:hypothetical protein [Cognatishimia sp. MH4019]|uniref:hypothetical protein n=1 Tax=Cognatishimia sp. MH4019 TaxID=2854030 RepID=UPI001CD73244|nr:hypothetical protein [Cognatishimia sp. MH4019]
MTDKWHSTVDLKTRTVILAYVHERTSQARDGLLRDFGNDGVSKAPPVPDLIRDPAAIVAQPQPHEAPDHVRGGHDSAQR